METKLALSQRVYKQRYLLMMALPAVVWMIIFNYIPMYGIIIAFQNYRIIKPIIGQPFIGFEHFVELFTSGDFTTVMKNTLGISFLRLFIGFPLPIIFAIFLNEIKSNSYKRIIQTVSYLPHFLSWAVLGGIMTNWLSDVGFINEILLNFGFINKPIFFLAEPEMFWGIAVFSDIWKELGWGAIIYLAAIAGISPSLYEAATVDGANRFQKMIHITLPSIAPTISIFLILAISGMLNTNFEQILVLRNSLNQSYSDVIDVFVYRTGMMSGRYSYAQAVGLFKSVVALILLGGANKVTKKISGHALF